MEKSQETKKYFKVNYFKYTCAYMCMYLYIQETALGIFLSLKTILKSQYGHMNNSNKLATNFTSLSIID